MKFYFTMMACLRLTPLAPLLVLLLGGGIALNPVLAQESPPQSRIGPILAPVELERLSAQDVPSDRPIITSTMISTTGLTPPSLWWTQQQVGGKLLKGWIAYPATDTQPAYVDLVVNRQLWNVSGYLERYGFVHHFGQSAQTFGYVVRVFNDVGEYLAVYPCVGQAASPQPNRQRQTCSVILNSSGLGVLQNDDPFSNF
ncbi:MAG: hypothetical protein F6K30_13610 [Cyanothece sp. SIO2G6]|nr:hypothetical protein [Cyanothece sp. SIO2G6]